MSFPLCIALGVLTPHPPAARTFLASTLKTRMLFTYIVHSYFFSHVQRVGRVGVLGVLACWRVGRVGVLGVLGVLTCRGVSGRVEHVAVRACK